MQDVKGCSQWVHRRLCRNERHIPDGNGLVLLWIDGNLVFQNKHGDLPAGTGDIVVADRSLLTTIASDDDWSAQALYLPDRRVFQHVSHAKQPVVMTFCGNSHLTTALKQLWTMGNDWSAMGTDDRMIEAAFLDLMTSVGIRMVAESTEARVPAHAVDTVDRARVLIRTHLADPDFGVAELARQMRVSPRQLSALFTPLGTTTARAIMEMRIERGRILLADPVNARRQIADIALACGFSDQNYFARCFHRFRNQTPNAYRKSCRDEDISASNLELSRKEA